MQKIPVTRSAHLKAKPVGDSLPFGRYFTDHMLVSDWSDAKWSNTRIVPYQNLQIDPGASVLHYGQALFEGMKAFCGVDNKIRIFRPDMNCRRLREGAERLCMQAPPQDLFIDSLLSFVHEENDWVPKSTAGSLYLRPTLIGTEAFLGVRPAEKFMYFVIASPVGTYFGQGTSTLKIWVESKYSRAAVGGIGAVKAAGNYAASLLAAQTAKQRGFAQVLWLDSASRTQVEEVGTMNIFFRIKNTVVTPALNGSILPGVMRDSCIELLRDIGYQVEERPIELKELISAAKSGDLKEAWGTGTAASISPVSLMASEKAELILNDGKPGELSQQLFQEFTDIFYARKPDTRNWTRLVP